ncbi:uncharacterized protein V6R79_009873 [Siganus canaliculatus]
MDRLLSFVLTLLLFETSPSSGAEPPSPCPPRWLLSGNRCFAFFPVWSSWNAADFLCAQTGGALASLHTPEERRLVRQAAAAFTPVWLGGVQVQNGSWFWSDDSAFDISSWTNQTLEDSREGGACAYTYTSAELVSAPCEELSFYICSIRAGSDWLPETGASPAVKRFADGVGLFDVMWSFSDSLVEEILQSSSVLTELRSRNGTASCYARFRQQEALYLHRVSSTLETLLWTRPPALDDVALLLTEAFKHYRSRLQTLPPGPPPLWLTSALQAFHSVVLDEPLYLLVALSARSSLYGLFSHSRTGSPQGPEGPDLDLYQDWREEVEREASWTLRFRKVLQKHQDQMDEYKSVRVFREHMMNQKLLHKAVSCDEEE